MWRLWSLCFAWCGVVVGTADAFEQPVIVHEVVYDSWRPAMVLPPAVNEARAPMIVEDDGARQAYDNLRPLIIEQQRAQYGYCGEWHDTAISVGWTEKDWKTLRWIIARETGNTCDPLSYNGNEATRDRSYGLLQINMRGRLEPDRLVRCKLESKEQLWDPATNLRCGRILFEQYGWEPWKKSS